MRHIPRKDLGPKAQRYLDKKQKTIDTRRKSAGFNPERVWNAARQTAVIKRGVLPVLQTMAGKRERCMYCEDSHGGDIEHFWPKTTHPEKMFTWKNILLCCTDCGRNKGSQFPVDGTGNPLLIDPTAENPWDFLEFDPDTGNIVARYDVAADAFSPKGVQTVAVLKLDKREAIAIGYQRSLKRLRYAINAYVKPGSGKPKTSEVLDALRIADEHGIAEWCFKHSGKQDSPFKEFFARFPSVARKVAASL